jgi:hypothetical protein
VRYWGGTYIDFHLLVAAVVHNQAVGNPNSMGFHGMAGDVGVIAHIGIVEVCDPLGSRGAGAIRAVVQGLANLGHGGVQ